MRKIEKEEEIFSYKNISKIEMIYKNISKILSLSKKFNEKFRSRRYGSEGYKNYLSTEKNCWEVLFFEEDSDVAVSFLKKIRAVAHFGHRLSPFFADEVLSNLRDFYQVPFNFSNELVKKKFDKMVAVMKQMFVPTSKLRNWAKILQRIEDEEESKQEEALKKVSSSMSYDQEDEQQQDDNPDDSQDNNPDNNSEASSGSGEGENENQSTEGEDNLDNNQDQSTSGGYDDEENGEEYDEEDENSDKDGGKEKEDSDLFEGDFTPEDDKEMDDLVSRFVASQRIMQRQANVKKIRDLYWNLEMFVDEKDDESPIPLPKDQTEKRNAETLRRFLLLDKMREKFEETGTVLSISRYVSFKMKNEDNKIFKNKNFGKGGLVVFLGDCSGSMSDYWELQNRLYRILGNAYKGYIDFKSFFFGEKDRKCIIKTSPFSAINTPLITSMIYIQNKIRIYGGNYKKIYIIVFSDLESNRGAGEEMLQEVDRKCRSSNVKIIFLVPEREKFLYRGDYKLFPAIFIRNKNQEEFLMRDLITLAKTMLKT